MAYELVPVVPSHLRTPYYYVVGIPVQLYVVPMGTCTGTVRTTTRVPSPDTADWSFKFGPNYSSTTTSTVVTSKSLASFTCEMHCCYF